MQRPSSVQLCDRWLIMQREIRRTAIQLCYIAVFSGTCILFARSNPTCLQNAADAFSILYSAQVSRQYSMDRSNIINLPLEWYLQVSQWSKKSLPSDGEIIFLRISLLTALHGLRNIINTSLIRQEGVFFVVVVRLLFVCFQYHLKSWLYFESIMPYLTLVGVLSLLGNMFEAVKLTVC